MSATAGVKPAVKAKVYLNTDEYDDPTWVDMDIIRDVNTGKPWDLGDASTRASRVKLYAPTQQDWALTATARCDNADTNYKALTGASVSAAMLDLLILDGPITSEGTEGYRAWLHVSETGQDQTIGNNLYKNFDFKPGVAPDLPKCVTVGASSALTMTSPG
ncbi:hypothetical protein [Zavarzinella formosa]|uniref:hypothetical protein n=1 Tax=Zavarzinella formosa TaxID=360055 RepID=UPI000317FFE6|nr:hypothetical protein [Zavarzinella formosa]